jgi:hypothetical protein
MTLNEFASKKRLALFENLRAGRDPGEGVFDPELLREARTKSAPQLGATRYEPDAIVIEFIYPDPDSSATVLSVRLESPERIVFLPVPSWVVETIWQGEIDGSFQFERDARRLVEAFQAELDPEANANWFLPRAAKRRE